MDDELLDRIAHRLGQAGIDARFGGLRDDAADGDVDGYVELDAASIRHRFDLVVKTRPTLSSIAQSVRSLAGLFVCAEYVDARTGIAFRDSGIQYADGAGNAYIRFGSVLIDIRGRKPAATTRGGSGRPTTAGNLFSTRRSQVIMVLLAWPELWTASVREIAEAAGVSTGQAHDTLNLLGQAGFHGDDSAPGRSPEDLLEYWAAAYTTGLGPKLLLDRFVADQVGQLSSVDDDQLVARSGESASGVGIARPVTLTVYVTDLDARLPVLNRWRRDPQGWPNVFVRRLFWASPVAHEHLPVAQGQDAPWPIVYGDLLAAGDPRLIEVAHDYRRQHVRSRRG